MDQSPSLHNMCYQTQAYQWVDIGSRGGAASPGTPHECGVECFAATEVGKKEDLG